MDKQIRILLACMFIQFSLHAQNSIFFKTYGGNGSDYGLSVINSSDKTYTIVGATESFGNGSVDAYLLNIDSLGNYNWSKTFGGPNIEWAYDLVEIADSGFVICGYSNSGSLGYDSYLIKTDKVGNLVWEKTIDFTEWNFLYCLHKTSDSNYVAVGEIHDNTTGFTNGLLIKFDQNGDTLWTKQFDNGKNDRFNSVIETTTGELVMTGMTELLSEDVWVVKTNNLGDLVWEYTFGDTLSDEGNDLIETTDGRYLVTGKFGNNSNFLEDHLLLKVNINGTYYLHNYFNESNSDYGVKSVQYTGDANSISIGTTKTIGQGGYDFRASYDNTYLGGNWNPIYVFTAGEIDDDMAHSADTTYDKGIIIVGTTTSTLFGPTNIMVYKKDSTNSFPSFSNEVFDLNISEEETIEVNFYPNPTTGVVTFENDQLLNTDYVVFDITGRKVQAGKLQANQLFLNGLNSGAYILLFTEFNSVIRIVKE